MVAFCVIGASAVAGAQTEVSSDEQTVSITYERGNRIATEIVGGDALTVSLTNAETVAWAQGPSQEIVGLEYAFATPTAGLVAEITEVDGQPAATISPADVGLAANGTDYVALFLTGGQGRGGGFAETARHPFRLNNGTDWRLVGVDIEGYASADQTYDTKTLYHNGGGVGAHVEAVYFGLEQFGRGPGEVFSDKEIVVTFTVEEEQ